MRKTTDQLKIERDDLRVEADLNDEAIMRSHERWRELQSNRRRIEKRCAEIGAIIADRVEEN